MSKFIILMSFLATSGQGFAEDIAIDNTSNYMGGGIWNWTIFIKNNSSKINEIRCIEYKLHKSFNKKPIEICERGGNAEMPFSYNAQAWGEFIIPIKVTFKDGKNYSMDYKLNLVKATEETRQLPIQINNVAIKNNAGSWDWKIFLESSDDVLNQVKCVEYTLHPTFPNPIQEICEKGNNENQAFVLTGNGWGAFEAKIRILLKDGGVQKLVYTLKF
jgi:transcription initiation factor IIF auxiliary subunit